MSHWTVDVDSARRGGLDRARLMIHVLHPERLILLFGDAERDDVVRIDIESPPSTSRPLALSQDGTRVLLSIGSPSTPETDLVCRELATGAQRSHGGLLGLQSAAFSPDGREAAASLSDLDGSVTLAVLDLESGTWRRLSASDELTSASQTVTWSPDGKFIVVDYISADDEDAVAVVDTSSGDLVQAHERVCLINSSNGAWLDAARLVLVGNDAGFDESPFRVLSVYEGTLTAFGERRQEGILRAVVGDALLWTTNDPSGSATGVEVSNLDGAGRRVIAALSPALPLGRVEVAPLAWTAH